MQSLNFWIAQTCIMMALLHCCFTKFSITGIMFSFKITTDAGEKFKGREDDGTTELTFALNDTAGGHDTMPTLTRSIKCLENWTICTVILAH